MQGQDILEISPEDQLIAECMVPAKSIGYIKKNQSVKFQMDTYNYNQWGFLSGTVHDIDYNLVNDQQKGSFFKVRCRMDQNFLSLPNGNKAFVGKGNTFNARFYLLDVRYGSSCSIGPTICSIQILALKRAHYKNFFINLTTVNLY